MHGRLLIVYVKSMYIFMRTWSGFVIPFNTKLFHYLLTSVYERYLTFSPLYLHSTFFL